MTLPAVWMPRPPRLREREADTPLSPPPPSDPSPQPEGRGAPSRRTHNAEGGGRQGSQTPPPPPRGPASPGRPLTPPSASAPVSPQRPRRGEAARGRRCRRRRRALSGRPAPLRRRAPGKGWERCEGVWARRGREEADACRGTAPPEGLGPGQRLPGGGWNAAGCRGGGWSAMRPSEEWGTEVTGEGTEVTGGEGPRWRERCHRKSRQLRRREDRQRGGRGDGELSPGGVRLGEGKNKRKKK